MLADISPAGRFVPASLHDFDVYAKNLSWILNTPLSKARQTLAALYGYGSEHELRQTLKKDHVPGVFSAAPSIPPFLRNQVLLSGADHLAPGHPTCKNRVLRTWQTMADLEVERDRDLGFLCRSAVIEAGFFCSPKVHRVLFEQVKQGLTAVRSKEPTAASAFLQEHWPVGFWTLLEILYPEDQNLDESAFDEKDFFSVIVPTKAIREMWGYKAPLIYSTIVENLLGGEPAPWIYEEPIRARECGPDAPYALFDFDVFEANGDCPQAISALLDKLSEADAEALCIAIEHGNFDLRAHPFLRDVLSEPEIENLSSQLRQERFRQLRSLSAAARQSAQSGVAEVLHAVTAWSPAADAGDDASRLECYVAVQYADSGWEARDQMQCLRYDATFFRRTTGSASSRTHTATPVGAILGHLLVPFGPKYQVHPETWFEVLDGASQQLNDVWKVLQSDYFPSKGVHDISEFSRRFDYRTIAVAEPILLPGHGEQGLESAMFDLLAGAFDDDYESSTLDDTWFWHARSLAGKDLDPDRYPYGYVPDRLKIPLGKPQVFIVPVCGAKSPGDRIAYPQLMASLARFRKNPQDPAEVQKQHNMRAMTALAADKDWEILCYDPNEWPDT